MLTIIAGLKGSGKTKTLIEMVNKNAEESAGSVVCLEKGNALMHEIKYHVRLIDTEEYGIYHGTGEGECSWYEFTKEIVALSGIDATVSPCTTEEYPTPAKRPAYSSLENMMFKTTVGNEFRPWRDALKVFIENNSN